MKQTKHFNYRGVGVGVGVVGGGGKLPLVLSDESTHNVIDLYKETNSSALRTGVTPCLRLNLQSMITSSHGNAFHITGPGDFVRGN